MIISNGSNAASDIDSKMAKVLAALDAFEQALTKATQAVGAGASPTTVQAALGAAQNSSFAVNAAASSPTSSFSTTAAVFGGGVPFGGMAAGGGGGKDGTLIQGSAGVPFGGGQSPVPMRDAMGRFVASSGTSGFVGAGAGSGGNSSSAYMLQNSAGGSGFAFPLFGDARRNAQAIHYGAQVVGQGISYAAGLASNGGDDPYGRGSLVASGLSAAIGLGVSAFATPLAGSLAFGASEAVLQPLSRYIMAPTANKQAAVMSMQPFLGSYAGQGAKGYDDFFTGTPNLPFGVIPGSPRAHEIMSSSRLGKMSSYVNSRVPDELRVDDYGKDMGATLAGVSSGLFQGGLDPFGKGASFDGGIVSPLERYRSQFDISNLSKSHIKNVTAAIDVSGQAIINHARFRYQSNETLAETYSRRLGTLFGNEAPEVTKQIAPILGSLPETGGNLADILHQFGAQNTNTYLRITDNRKNADGSEKLGSDINPMFLAKASANIRSDERQNSFAQLQARGSGAAQVSALTGEIGHIGEIPGGKDSLLYAQKSKELRDAGRQAFDEKTITSFGLPMTKLEGQLARADIAPFSPTNIYRLSLQHINLNQKHIGELTEYMTQRRASGQLSEREEQDLTGQIESAKTATAQDQARLSEGILNRMPAMLSGGGRFQARYTSPMLATMALRQMGNNTVRMFGAADGKALHEQDAEYADVQGGTSTRAGSRTAAFNNHAGGDDSKAMITVLTQIRDLLARQGGGKKTGRADEMLGALDTMIKRASSAGGGGDGTGGAFN